MEIDKPKYVATFPGNMGRVYFHLALFVFDISVNSNHQAIDIVDPDQEDKVILESGSTTIDRVGKYTNAHVLRIDGDLVGFEVVLRENENHDSPIVSRAPIVLNYE